MGSRLSLIRRCRLVKGERQAVQQHETKSKKRSIGGAGFDPVNRIIERRCTKCRWCIGIKYTRASGKRTKVDCPRCGGSGLDPEPLDQDKMRRAILGE